MYSSAQITLGKGKMENVRVGCLCTQISFSRLHLISLLNYEGVIKKLFGEKCCQHLLSSKLFIVITSK